MAHVMRQCAKQDIMDRSVTRLAVRIVLHVSTPIIVPNVLMAGSEETVQIHVLQIA